MESLFHAALALLPESRPAFLSRACAGDESLRREVTSLLAAADSEMSLGDLHQALALKVAAAGESPVALRERLESVLSGGYTIERELGGGMSRVFLARDEKLGRRVVVKVLPPALAAGVSAARFAREIRLAAALQHPHIVPLLGAGDADGVPYYTMPYVPGESLRARLAHGAVPRAHALAILRDVAEALAHAHRRSVVHRDVKPENILLTDGGAMVADFGIARAIDASGAAAPAGPASPLTEELTVAGGMLGTPAYAAPEQAVGGRVDARADLYAWGVMAYELLAGRHPFDGCATAQQYLTAHVSAVPPALDALHRDVSSELAALVMRCLEKAPARRPENAEAVLAVLNTLRGDARTSSAPWRRRARAAAAVALGFAAVASGAAYVRGWEGGWVSRADIRELDEHRVTVFPLVVSRDPGAATSVGEDVATMIGSALDGAGALRWVDGWRLLDARARADVRALEPRAARELARAQRSGRYVTGRMVRRGDSTDVFLNLHAVAGDSVVATAHATGPAGDPWRVGLHAVTRLLPALLPGGATDLAAGWDARTPPAITRFLAGAAAFRRARPREALSYFQAAVDLDSGFALAALRGAQAAAWLHRGDVAAALIRVALGGPMAPRDAHFARGYAAYLDGRADSAASEFRRALALDPEMAVAWAQLGETYTHLLPPRGRPDSLAEAAFANAHRLDSSAVHLLHPIEIRLRRGPATAAIPLVRRFLAADPEPELAAQVSVMEMCVRRGPAGVNWSAAARAHPFAVLAAAQALAVGGARLPCAAAAYGSVVDADTAAADAQAVERRASALAGLVGVLASEERAAEVVGRVAASVARGDGGSSLLPLAATVVPALAEAAAAVARDDAARYGAAYERCPFVERRWILAVYEASRGRAAVAGALAAALAARVRSGMPRDEWLMARAARAHALLARGDSARAAAAFAGLLAEPMPGGSEIGWTPGAARGAERLAYARLLLARGAPQEARAVADVFDSAAPASYALYLPASLTLRARAAEAMGDDDGASRYRARLAALTSVAGSRDRTAE